MAASKALDLIVDIETKGIKALDAASNSFKKLSKQTLLSNKALKKFSAASSKASKSLGGAISKLSGTFLNLKTAIAGVGVGIVAKGFLDTAVQFEKFQTSLETIEGSSAKAKKAMGWISDFTAKTPFELAEVTENFVKLRAYGIDPTIGIMKTLGNTASAMAKPLEQAVEAYADALTGEFERLKEFGIKSKTIGDDVTFSWTENGKEMSKTVKKTSTDIGSALTGIFSRFDGAMDKQSKTFGGMMSNLKDSYVFFQKTVMDSGVFAFLKENLKALLDKIAELKANGTLAVWAQELSDSVVKAFEFVKEKIQGFITDAGGIEGAKEKIFNAFSKMIEVAGIFGSAFVKIATALAPVLDFLGKILTVLEPYMPVIAPVIATLGALAIAFIAIINPITQVITFLASMAAGIIAATTPFGLMVIAAAALGVGLRALWEHFDVNKIFEEFVSTIVDSFKKVKDWIITTSDAIGLAIIALWDKFSIPEIFKLLYEHIKEVWGGIKSFFSSSIKKIIGYVDSFFNAFKQPQIFTDLLEWVSSTFAAIRSIVSSVMSFIQSTIALAKKAASFVTGGSSKSSSPVKKRTGGSIPGYGGGDKVRALLEAGEFVIRKEAVRNVGRSTLERINNMSTGRMKFATGGIVPSKNSQSNTFNFSAPITATGPGMGDLFRKEIIPELKKSIRLNTGSIATLIRQTAS